MQRDGRFCLTPIPSLLAAARGASTRSCPTPHPSAPLQLRPALPRPALSCPPPSPVAGEGRLPPPAGPRQQLGQALLQGLEPGGKAGVTLEARSKLGGKGGEQETEKSTRAMRGAARASTGRQGVVNQVWIGQFHPQKHNACWHHAGSRAPTPCIPQAWHLAGLASDEQARTQGPLCPGPLPGAGLLAPTRDFFTLQPWIQPGAARPADAWHSRLSRTWCSGAWPRRGWSPCSRRWRAAGRG
jgi:hypothetical protein